VNVTQNGFTLTGTASGGLLVLVPVTGTVSSTVSITPSGLGLSGTAAIQPIVDTPFRIESNSGGNMTASLSNSGLSFSGVRLRADGVLGATVNLPAFTILSSGNFTISLNPSNMTVAGIPCASISFTLQRQNGAISLDPFAANLNIPGFSQRITGSVNSAGNVALDYAGSLTMGGFTAANGGLHLRNSGLSADGTFTLRFGTTTFGTVGCSGGVSYNASNSTVSLLLLFSTLTVIVSDGWLECRFGVGLIWRRIRLSDVRNAEAVRNKWYYGWGIRLTPHGWLWNVAGLDAVELTFANGKKFRIGTDEPGRLLEAIRET